MTEGIRRTIYKMTGDRVLDCPWMSLHDPFVGRVMSVVALKEHGGLSSLSPSRRTYRLTQGVAHYEMVSNRVEAALEDMRRESEKKARASRGG